MTSLPDSLPSPRSRQWPRRAATHAAILLALSLAALPGVASTSGAAAYTLDPVHTRVMFAIEHAGFSKALGTVSESTGVLLFDPDDWTTARLDVRVPLTRLDLGDAKWNAATLARNLLDGERHPEARFVSDLVRPLDATHAQVCGQLSLRGVTRPLCLDVSFNALKRHPLPPFRRTAGFSATGTLSRSDFGIDAWPALIGDTVELRIEAEAVRADRAVADGLGAPAPLPEPQPEPEAETELLFEDEIAPEHEPLPPDEGLPPPDPAASAITP